MSATATAPAAPVIGNDRLWTGNFTEDRHKWPQPSLDEIYAEAARIEAERRETTLTAAGA
ncbi:hypothetical protein R80B4_00119 [Fibrobacteres bacterium R8-0-B4]